MKHLKKYNENNIIIDTDELADELMDSIYMNGKKERDNYTLTIPQMEQVAIEMSSWVDKKIKTHLDG